jgi:hypothetical protein
MIKHEIKVEFSNSEALKTLISKAYFEQGQMGKIMGKENFIKVDETTDEVAYTIFKGLNSATAKITNEEVIDGTMRFIIDETQGEVRLYPISIYCIQEEEKYIFY